MVKLQPSFRRKETPADGPPKGEAHEHKETHAKTTAHKKPMQDKRLLAGIVVLIAAVMLILIFLWVYPPQPAGPGAVSDSQVRAELARVKDISTYPNNLRIDTYQYPKVFGTWDGRTLVENYFCSDVCPDYGRVDLVFQGVDAEECASIGGKALRDLAWGGYLGCEPRV